MITNLISDYSLIVSAFRLDGNLKRVIKFHLSSIQGHVFGVYKYYFN